MGRRRERDGGLQAPMRAQRRPSEPAKLVLLVIASVTLAVALAAAASAWRETGGENGLAHLLGGASIYLAAALAGVVLGVIGACRLQGAQLAERRARDETVAALQGELAARVADLGAAQAAAGAANTARSELAAAMSHEIRTPMSSVMAMAERLAAADAPPRQRRLAEVIARSGSSLLATVGDMAGATDEAGGPGLERKPTDICELAEDVACLFWDRATAKALDLAVYVDPATPGQVLGDPTRLRQVIGILVNNAIACTEAGGVLVEIEPDTPASLRVNVRDTGATARNAGDGGLGLANCRRLVTSMGGRFHPPAETSAGSTFGFRIPVSVVEPAAAWPAARAGVGRAAIAHEGVATRRALGRYLARAGYSVASPREEARPDVIFGPGGELARESAGPPTVRLGEYGDAVPHAGALLAQPFRRAELEALLRRMQAGEPLSERMEAPPATSAVSLPANTQAPVRGRSVTQSVAAPPPEVQSLLDDLAEAIAGGQLSLVYQPQLDRDGRRILGVECLVRWTHPVRGVVNPVDFIPITEAWGGIRQLTDWVMERAVAETADLAGLQVAFNASAVEFTDAGIVERIGRLLARTGFDPRRLEVEITETAILNNEEQVRDNMNTLRSLGMKVALDDFGAGYSSLGHLRRYPFDKLKIDREFVLDCTQDVQSATVVHAVVSIGRALGMKVVAEGVETEQQHQFLRIAGVHAVQGYLFGKPVPIAVLREMMSPVAVRARA